MNILSWILIGIWVALVAAVAKSEGKNFLTMLVKSFFAIAALALLHTFSSILFWIIMAPAIIISVVLAIKGG